MVARQAISGLLVLAAVLMISSHSNAQHVASITGVVTDQTGAVIPAVSVTLENPQTGITYKTVTREEASYTFSQIKPGPGYKIFPSTTI